LGFRTATGVPETVGDGSFTWLFNDETANARCYLGYEAHTNNSDLVVGTKYRMEYTVEQLEKSPVGGFNVALTTANPADITITDSDTQAVRGEVRTLFIEFTPDDPAFAVQFRCGAGTTADHPAAIRVSNPRLMEVIAETGPPGDAKTISDAWREMLLSQTGLPEENYHRNDYWYALLGTLGYEGSLNDRELAFWDNGGVLEPVEPPATDWIFFNPLGLATGQIVADDHVSISMPDGTEHDIDVGANNAPRWRRLIEDRDFTVTSEIDATDWQQVAASAMGILVEESWADPDNFTAGRNELRRNANSPFVGAQVRIEGGTTSTEPTFAVSYQLPIFIRVDRLRDYLYFYTSRDEQPFRWALRAITRFDDLTANAFSFYTMNWNNNPALDGEFYDITFKYTDIPGLDWLWLDIVDDCSYTATEDTATISVPGNESHDIWESNNEAPRLRLEVEDRDFDFEVAVDEVFAGKPNIQTAGILVEFGGEYNLLRADYYVDGQDRERAFVASLLDNNANMEFNQNVAMQPGAKLRFERRGNEYTALYALNGSTWQEAATMTVDDTPLFVAVWAGNAGGFPENVSSFSDITLTYTPPLEQVFTMTAESLPDGAVGFVNDPATWTDNYTVRFASEDWTVEKVTSTAVAGGRLDIVLSGDELPIKDLFKRVQIMSEFGTFEVETADADFNEGLGLWRWQQTGEVFELGEDYAVVFVE
jgi:hypothetical protein